MYVLQFLYHSLKGIKQKKSWTCGMKQNKFNGNVYYEALKSQQNNYSNLKTNLLTHLPTYSLSLPSVG